MDLDDLAATALTPRVGRWFVGLVGVAIMVAGVLQLRLGVTTAFRNILTQGMSGVELAITIVVGALGYVTLGVLSMMVGYSLVEVALRYDPSEAGGWEDALWLLSTVVEGRWLLGLVSAGLIFYGFYFVLLMRYRAL
jgi:hypothetical protein